MTADLKSEEQLGEELFQAIDNEDMLGNFPPKSVELRKPLAIRNLQMVWKFLNTFADVLDLWPFTLDEFVEALHDYEPTLLGEIHVALLRFITKDIEDVARTPSIGLGTNPGRGHPQIVEGAYAWGFDIRCWQRKLNPYTWPEVLRQFAMSAGFGPQLKKGSLQLTPGTETFAAFHVPSLEGSKGITITEVADRIQKSGPRDLTTSKTLEASLAATLSRDSTLFERTAPSTYCVRAAYRKDPDDAEGIQSAAKGKIQIFEGGFPGDAEIDESNFGEPWVQGLMEGEYSDLNVEERLSALSALIGVAIEGHTFRVNLKEHLEAAHTMKKQTWAEAQLDIRRMMKEYVTSISAKTNLLGQELSVGPSSSPDTVDQTSSFTMELGRTDTEKTNALKLYQDFHKCMWKECLNSSILCAINYGKKRCSELLVTCEICHNSYFHKDNSCPVCHRIFWNFSINESNSGEPWVQVLAIANSSHVLMESKTMAKITTGNQVLDELSGGARCRGSTIIALMLSDAIILGADGRCTREPVDGDDEDESLKRTVNGEIITDDEAKKIYYLGNGLVSAWAGGVWDKLTLVAHMYSKLELLDPQGKSRPTVSKSAHVILDYAVRLSNAKKIRMDFAAFLAGWDISINNEGILISTPRLALVNEGGCMDVPFPFLALGSGGNFALTEIAKGYKMNMLHGCAKKLIKRALNHAAKYDSDTGGEARACVITRTGLQHEKLGLIENSMIQTQEEKLELV